MLYVLFQKKFLALFCQGFAALILVVCSEALAADGVLLPSAPNGPGGADSITTSQGVHCSQSVNSSGGYLDFGVTGGGALTIGGGGGVRTDPNMLGYARIIIPIGKQPERIDCSQLYRLEIDRLKKEIELLTIGLQ